MSFTIDESDVIGRITIDLINDTNYCFEKIPQGTGDGRYILVTLNENGVPYNFSNGLMATIGGKNSGGTNIYNTCGIYQENGINKILVPVSNQISATAGIGKYRVELINKSDSIVVMSFNLNILVTSAPYDVHNIIQSNEYQALVDAISNSNSWTVGNAVPSDSIGSINDYYLDSTTGEIYKKDLTTWQDTGSNLKENVFIRYASTSDLTKNDMTTVIDNNTRFIGVSINSSITAPITKSSYTPWQRIRNDCVSQSYSYQVSNNGSTPPTGNWKNNIPSTIQEGQYLWIKIVNNFEDGSTSLPFYSVSRNGETGTPAGFGTPTYDNTEADNIGTAKVEVTASGPDTAKVFDFKFINMKGTRGSQWFSGTDVSGTGRNTTYTSANACVNDMYTNTDTGNIYQCSAVHDSYSTWVAAGNLSAGIGGDMKSTDYAKNGQLGVVDKAIDIANITLVEGVLEAGNAYLTLNDSVFVDESNQFDDTYTYKVFTSDPKIHLVDMNIITGSATLKFGKQTKDINVAVEVHKHEKQS